VSIAWICATPAAREEFDTEREAESRAAQIVQGKSAEFAVVYRVNVED
jgi:hypothetical protein